jgi:hypothetical protein
MYNPFSFTQSSWTTITHVNNSVQDKHLFLNKNHATNCLGWMFHPTIDSMFQISTTNHPQPMASNPQNRVVSHSPLTTHKDHNPIDILLQLSRLFHQLSSS